MNALQLLDRETAHFSDHERDQLATVLADARALVTRYPTTPQPVLSAKLLTLHPVPSWVCQLVAKAALHDPTPSGVAQAA